MRLPLACLAVLASSVLVCPAATASSDDGQTQDCQVITRDDTTHYSTDQPSLPLQEMGVDDAWARLKQEHVKPGQGVTVAVIDSGVAADAPVTFAGQPWMPATRSRNPRLPRHRGGGADRRPRAARRRRTGRHRAGAKIFDVQVYDEAGASTAPGAPSRR